jgi:hypothetical protein
MQASNDSNIIVVTDVEAYDEGSMLVNLIVPLLFALRTTTTVNCLLIFKLTDLIIRCSSR